MADPDYFVSRIIDANLNRAREALRVMEEYARFGLDDAGLSGAIKETRHALARVVSEFEQRGACSAAPRERRGQYAHGVTPPRGSPAGTARAEARGSLVAHREIAGDVGRDVRTDSEYQRADALDVAVASCKRLSEALRAIEEYGKVVDPAFAVTVERIRYRGYELERRLALLAHARERFGQVRLYVIVTESLCRGDWLATAEAALLGGADCLQLREKQLSDSELLSRAARLVKLCRDRGALSIVNDRPDIAAACHSDGVHLGQTDLPVAAARRVLPPRAIVGVSAHTVEQVAAAAADAPDYIAVGPMFATPTKPRARIAGPTTLAAARALTSLPLVAIGGINIENSTEVLSAGRCCLCVCSSVIGRANVNAATARLRTLIDESASGQAPVP